MPDEKEKMLEKAGYKSRPALFGQAWEHAKKGDTLEGKVLIYKSKVPPNDQDLIVVDDATGQVKTVWLSDDLVGRINPEDRGKFLYLEYLGDEKRPGNRRLKRYFVAFKE